MTTYTIHSRAHGDVDFTIPMAGGYVRVRFDGKSDRQPCEGGAFIGPTLHATPETLPGVARRWWKQHLRLQREWA